MDNYYSQVATRLDLDASPQEIKQTLYQFLTDKPSNKVNDCLMTYLTAAPSCNLLLQLFDKYASTGWESETGSEILSQLLNIFSSILFDGTIDTFATWTISCRRHLVNALLNTPCSKIGDAVTDKCYRFKVLERLIDGNNLLVVYSCIQCLTAIAQFSTAAAKVLIFELEWNSDRMHRLCDTKLKQTNSAPFPISIDLTKFSGGGVELDASKEAERWPAEWGSKQISVQTLCQKPSYSEQDCLSRIHPHYATLSRRTSYFPIKYGIRQQYALLIEAFLDANDKSILTHLVRGSRFVSQYFYRLENDRPIDAIAFLQMVKIRIVQSKEISPAAKTGFFNRFILHCLSNLLAKYSTWEDYDVLVHEHSKSSSHEHFSSIPAFTRKLPALCFPSSFSRVTAEILLSLFTEEGMYSSVSGHSTLLEFCLQLKPLLPPQQYVLLNILGAHRHLYPRYVRECSLAIVPKESVECLMQMRFLVEVLCLQYPDHLLRTFKEGIDPVNSQQSTKDQIKRLFKAQTVEECLNLIKKFFEISKLLDKPAAMADTLFDAESPKKKRKSLQDYAVGEDVYLTRSIESYDELLPYIMKNASMEEARLTNLTAEAYEDCSIRARKDRNCIGSAPDGETNSLDLEIYNTLSPLYLPPKSISRLVLTKGILHPSRAVGCMTLCIIEAIVWRAYVLEFILEYLAESDSLPREEKRVIWRCKQVILNLQFELKCDLPDLQTLLSFRARLWDEYSKCETDNGEFTAKYIYTEAKLLEKHVVKDAPSDGGELVLNITGLNAQPNARMNVDDKYNNWRSKGCVPFGLMLSYVFSRYDSPTLIESGEMLGKWSNVVLSMYYAIPSALLEDNFDWSKLLSQEALLLLKKNPVVLRNTIRLVTMAIGGFDQLNMSHVLRRSVIAWLERLFECWVTLADAEYTSMKSLSRNGIVKSCSVAIDNECDRYLRKYFSSFKIFEYQNFDELSVWLSSIRKMRKVRQKHLCSSFFLYCFAKTLCSGHRLEADEVCEKTGEQNDSKIGLSKAVSPFTRCVLSVLAENQSAVTRKNSMLQMQTSQQTHEVERADIHRFVYVSLQWICAASPNARHSIKKLIVEKGIWVPLSYCCKKKIDTEDGISSVYLCEWKQSVVDNVISKKIKDTWSECIAVLSNPMQHTSAEAESLSSNALVTETICNKYFKTFSIAETSGRGGIHITIGEVLNGINVAHFTITQLKDLMKTNKEIFEEIGIRTMKDALNGMKAITEAVKHLSESIEESCRRASIQKVTEQCLVIASRCLSKSLTFSSFIEEISLLYAALMEECVQLLLLLTDRNDSHRQVIWHEADIAAIIQKVWKRLCKIGVDTKNRTFIPLYECKTMGDGVECFRLCSTAKHLVEVMHFFNLYGAFENVAKLELEGVRFGKEIRLSMIELKFVAFRYLLQRFDFAKLDSTESISKVNFLVRAIVELTKECLGIADMNLRAAYLTALSPLVLASLRGLKKHRSWQSVSAASELFTIFAFRFSSDYQKPSDRSICIGRFENAIVPNFVNMFVELALSDYPQVIVKCLPYINSHFNEGVDYTPAILLLLLMTSISWKSKAFTEVMEQISKCRFFLNTEEANRSTSQIRIMEARSPEELCYSRIWIAFIQKLSCCSPKRQVEDTTLLNALDRFMKLLLPLILTEEESTAFVQTLFEELSAFASNAIQTEGGANSNEFSNVNEVKLMLEEADLVAYRHRLLGSQSKMLQQCTGEAEAGSESPATLPDALSATSAPDHIDRSRRKVANDCLELYGMRLRRLVKQIRRRCRHITKCSNDGLRYQSWVTLMRQTALLASSIKEMYVKCSVIERQFLLEISDLAASVQHMKELLEIVETDKEAFLGRKECSTLLFAYWKTLIDLHVLQIGCIDAIEVKHMSGYSGSIVTKMELLYQIVVNVLQSKAFEECLKVAQLEHSLLRFVASDIVPAVGSLAKIKELKSQGVKEICPDLLVLIRRNFTASLTEQDIHRRLIIMSDINLDENHLRGCSLSDFVEVDVEYGSDVTGTDYFSEKDDQCDYIGNSDGTKHNNKISNIFSFQSKRVELTLENFPYSSKLCLTSDFSIESSVLNRVLHLKEPYPLQSCYQHVYDMAYIIPYITERLRLMYLLSMEHLHGNQHIMKLFELYNNNRRWNRLVGEEAERSDDQMQRLYQSCHSADLESVGQDFLSRYSKDGNESIADIIGYHYSSFSKCIDEGGVYLKHFAQGGALALLILSLACTSKALRYIGYEGVSLYTQMLQNSVDASEVMHAAIADKYQKGKLLTKKSIKYAFKEAPQLLNLLITFRNTLFLPHREAEEATGSRCEARDKDLMIVPAFLLHFVAGAMSIIFRPESPLYPTINRFILSRPQFDLSDIPMFYEFFNSTRIYSAKFERLWLFKMLRRSFSQFGSIGAFAFQISSNAVFLNESLGADNGNNSLLYFWNAINRRHVVPCLLAACDSSNSLGDANRLNVILIFEKLTSVERNYLIEKDETFTPPLSIYVSIELIKNFGYLKWLKSQALMSMDAQRIEATDSLHTLIDMDITLHQALRSLKRDSNIAKTKSVLRPAVNPRLDAIIGLTRCIYNAAIALMFPPQNYDILSESWRTIDLYTNRSLQLLKSLRLLIDTYKCCAKSVTYSRVPSKTKMLTDSYSNVYETIKYKLVESPFSWSQMVMQPLQGEIVDNLAHFSGSARRTAFGGISDASKWKILSVFKDSRSVSATDRGEIWFHGMINAASLNSDGTSENGSDKDVLTVSEAHAAGIRKDNLWPFLRLNACLNSTSTSTTLTSLLDSLRSICRCWFTSYAERMGVRSMKVMDKLLKIKKTRHSVEGLELMEVVELVKTLKDGTVLVRQEGPLNLVNLAKGSSFRHFLRECGHAMRLLFHSLWSICWGLGNLSNSFTSLYDASIHAKGHEALHETTDISEVNWRPLRLFAGKCLSEVLLASEFFCVTIEVLETVKEHLDCFINRNFDSSHFIEEKAAETNEGLTSAKYMGSRTSDEPNSASNDKSKPRGNRVCGGRTTYEMVVDALHNYFTYESEATLNYKLFSRWTIYLKFLQIWVICGNGDVSASSTDYTILSDYIDFICENFQCLHGRDIFLDGLHRTV